MVAFLWSFQNSYSVTVGWGGRGGAGLQPGQLHLPDHDDPLDEGEISFLAGQRQALLMGQTVGIVRSGCSSVPVIFLKCHLRRPNKLTFSNLLTYNKLKKQYWGSYGKYADPDEFGTWAFTECVSGYRLFLTTSPDPFCHMSYTS